jgi:large subunit ribosomal protein L17
VQHNRLGRKLRRTTSHRLALFRNQLQSLVEHERITTTVEKAKELRPLIERAVTMARDDSIHARRRVLRLVPDRSLVKKLFDTLGPRFVDRPGGYTRILRLGTRRGDGAEMAILEFVDFKFEAKEKAPRRESMMERARRQVSSKVDTIRKEKPEEEEAGEGAEEESGRPSRKAKPAPRKAEGRKKGARKAAAPKKESKSRKQGGDSAPRKGSKKGGGGKKGR